MHAWRWTRRSVVGFTAALVMTAALVPAAAQAAKIPPEVVPPTASAYGASYDEWAARWWQWAYSVPAAVNPLYDETGADCGQGQGGPVWYLAGVVNQSGAASRTCDVPAGKAIFFPVLNDEFDNELCVEPDTTFTTNQLRHQAKKALDPATDLTAVVDGESFKLNSFRTSSPPFDITMPDLNLAQSFGCTEGAGTYPGAVGNGWYVMVKPLSTGVHTVSFSGRIPASGPFAGFTLSIDYTLNVG